MHVHRRVIKLGGSLLELPDVGKRFHAWLVCQSPAANLVIAGGGSVVDSIRKADAVHRFDEAQAHWLCVRAMSTTAQLGAELLGAQLVHDVPAEVREGALQVLDVQRFVESECRRQDIPLPSTWDVTSDSIAARVAERIGAELVLLKSATAPDWQNLSELAGAGYVDRYFPQAAARLPVVRFVNLRSNEFAEQCLADSKKFGWQLTSDH